MSSLRPCTSWTDDFSLVGQKAFTDQGLAATVAGEAFRVPVALLEGDEARSAETHDRLGAAITFVGKFDAVTLGTVGLVVL